MASVFTYDPDPPRVASPWGTPPISLAAISPANIFAHKMAPRILEPSTTLLADCGVTKLEAEPQEGPIEYKLHLLLRPRRSFTTTSTGQHVSGSHLSKARSLRPDSLPIQIPLRSAPLPLLNTGSRQNRLEHLTTQLLWRLQQSSPYHSSSTASLVLPILPDASSGLSIPAVPGKLLPGLEESRGALYELGVSDDGTFVGLVKDELEESLDNLRVMASSLGCKVEVNRMVVVGDCTWIEEARDETKSKLVRSEKLWVAEAFVQPNLDARERALDQSTSVEAQSTIALPSTQAYTSDEFETQTEQLRVSLTGSTTSGKSSLLGTLSTSTLDNGRGKSRLSLLKHRHEIASGITSSIAPELIGYHNSAMSNAEIVNYALANISSWTDVHGASEGGRLVLLTDSAGHPNYRRTTVRGLVSWVPHWTFCCIAADDDEGNAVKPEATLSAEQLLGSARVEVNLSKAHLQLCLKLGLPLVVVITKFDLASKAGLKEKLNAILSILKAAGRNPAFLSTQQNVEPEAPSRFIASVDEEEVKSRFASSQYDSMYSVVPIILTSAVNGTGINKLHALLRYLPIRKTENSLSSGSLISSFVRNAPKTLFHIDDIFLVSAQTHHLPSVRGTAAASGSIMSGYLRYGTLAVGDEVLLGPISTALGVEPITQDQRVSSASRLAKEDSPKPLVTRISHFQSSGHRPSMRSGDGRSAIDTGDLEWLRVRILSIRNLRLSVRRLLAGQVGTIAIIPIDRDNTEHQSYNEVNQSFRKGMVIINQPDGLQSQPPVSYRGFLAVFDDNVIEDMVGSIVIIYVASIRAQTKIVELEISSMPIGIKRGNSSYGVGSVRSTSLDGFGFDDTESDSSDLSSGEGPSLRKRFQATFQFIASREWVETGVQILVMPGSGVCFSSSRERGEKSGVGFDGLVGTITKALV